MTKITELPLIPRPVIVYPESDGAPMGETEWHVLLLARTLLVLRGHFHSRPEVHVGGNQFVYFEEGDPTQVVCPDIFVVFGARPGLRRTWKTWEEEGVFPHVIIEFLSRDTRRIDLGAKRGAYESLGVDEYFAFEPLEHERTPRLLGWRRDAQGFKAVEPEPAVAGRRLRSDRLGLFLEEDGDSVRFIDVARGTPLPYPEEETEARLAEAEARQRAEAEVARLQAELDALRRGPGRS